MKFIAIAFLLLLSIPGLSCECAQIKNLSEAQKQEFESNDIVFIGQVVSSDMNKGTYQLRVVESFKGKMKGDIVEGEGITSCSLFPYKEEELWLIYADYQSDGTIDINGCGLSRSFSFPYTNSDEAPIPPPIIISEEAPLPPSTDITMDELKGELTVVEYKKKALLVLKKEIEQLRKMK